ncbi:MAG: response regulator transcription factor [Thermomicrobiales bacterium]
MRLAIATGGKSAPRSFTTNRLPRDADERVSLIRASQEARLALEATIAASTEAVQRARAVSAELDARLAEVRLGTSLAGPPLEELAALSPREKEVLALIAAGRTNKAIADELYLSPNTIKTHVSSLLTKLRARTRVQLAVIAAQLMPLSAG